MAGGSGTRGRPYTDTIPKPMTRVHGRPLVERIARYVASSKSIDGIVIVADLRGMGAQIQNYMQDMDIGCPLEFMQDNSMGTGGDILCAKRAIGKESFLLWFSDNLCAVDIESMASEHADSGSDACIAVRSSRKEETGFVKVEGNIVTEFVEKPTRKLEMPECLGVYIMSPKILRAIQTRGKKKVDLSYDILGPLASRGSLCAHDIGKADWIDVESPVTLDRNAGRVRRIIEQMAQRSKAMSSRRAFSQKTRSSRLSRA